MLMSKCEPALLQYRSTHSQICLSGRMNRALLRSRSRSPKLRSTPDSAMNFELSQG